MKIDKNKIKPENGKIIIEPYQLEDETENGMVLVNSDSKGAPVAGKVIRVSDKSRYAEGQSVFFAKYSADTIELDSVEGKTKIYIVAEDEILAVIEEEKIPEEKYPAIAELKVERLSNQKNKHANS